MWILIVALVIIGTLAAGVSLLWDKEAVITPSADCQSCSDGGGKCEQECMMEASVRDTEYFDDEELDRFRGRESGSYTDKEADEFRTVMETMRKEELRAWSRSLVLRGVNMPDGIKDDFIMLVNAD